MIRILRATMIVLAAVLMLGGALTAGSASAAVNDDFSATTTDGCGVADFDDNGTWPDGSTNDDFVVVNDYCPDGHGVIAYAWLNGAYKGSKYNGLGYSGPPVYWDPFGNVHAGDFVELEVCLVDGSGDPTPAKCGYSSHVSADG